MDAARLSQPGELDGLLDWTEDEAGAGLLVGVEAEYLLRRSGEVFDFSKALPGLGLGTPHLVPADENARWRWSGTVLTCEGADLEMALSPAPADASRSLAGRLAAERQGLERVLPAGLEWSPVATHLSVSVPDAEVERTAHAFLRRYAPMLLDEPTVPGLVEVRARHGCVELKLAKFDAAAADRVATFMASGIRNHPAGTGRIRKGGHRLAAAGVRAGNASGEDAHRVLQRQQAPRPI
jgi:hypothetical protein